MVTYNDIRKDQEYKNDRGCCTVVATAIACQIPFKTAQNYLFKLGRKRHQGFHFYRHFKAIGKQFGYDIKTYSPKFVMYKGFYFQDKESNSLNKKPLKKATSLTVNNCIKHLPSVGTFVLHINGHVATLKDGVIQDWSRGRRFSIYRIYKFEKIQKIKKKNKTSKISSGYNFSQFIK